MKVSLCGPHSLETSTLAPTAVELLAPELGSEPLFRMNWYLSHQVGLWLVFWASVLTAKETKRTESKADLPLIMTSSRKDYVDTAQDSDGFSSRKRILRRSFRRGCAARAGRASR